jgi:hypothetical protein
LCYPKLTIVGLLLNNRKKKKIIPFNGFLSFISYFLIESNRAYLAIQTLALCFGTQWIL